MIDQISKVMVLSVTVPNTEYNVNTKNNTLNYDAGAGNVQVSITVGQYTSLSDVLDALAVSILVNGIVMTHSIDTLTSKATLTFDTALIIRRGSGIGVDEADESSISHVIGAGDLDTASLLVHIMPDLPDLSGLKKVYICSHTLSSSTQMISSDDRHSNAFAEINITEPFGFYCHRHLDDLNTSSELTLSMPGNISTVDIQLLDQKLRPVDLNGHDVYLTLKVFQ